MIRHFIPILMIILTGCAERQVPHTDFLILHLGSGATPILSERIQKLGYTTKINDGFLAKEEIMKINPKAVIVTGSPKSLLDDDDAPYVADDFYDLKIPVLGLCYGMQMIADQLGGRVAKCSESEKRVTRVTFTGECGITPQGLREMDVLMDHDDCVTHLPEGFVTDASSDITHHAMSCSPTRNMYLIQFHPERYDTVPESGVIIDLFVEKVMKEHAQKKKSRLPRAKA